jgi:phosphate acetyltransferase
MTENSFLTNVRYKAKSVNKLVAFPDACDERTLKTCAILRDEKIARPALVGNTACITAVAEELGIDLNGIIIFDPATSTDADKFANIFYEKRKHKGMTEEKAKETVLDPLYFAGFLLNEHIVDVVVGGNVSSTGDVMRAAILTVGTAPGISVVSSFFIMTWPDKMYCFGDCAINPNPNADQLADIAISSARNFHSITGIDPKIAMLSFSTNGSAEHELVDKVREATAIVKEKAPELAVDGEMQLDAAIVPAIGAKKFPGSEVAGNANCMIFPDLNAANIGYKLTQRLGGAEAVGPIVQGLALPYCDLSRGCSVDDMVNVSAICSLMA